MGRGAQKAFTCTRGVGCVKRRSYLASVPSSLLLAGCTQTGPSTEPTTNPSSPTTRSTTATPSTTTTSKNRGLEIGYGESVVLVTGEVWVAEVEVARTVRDLYKHPYYDVVGDPQEKYVTVEIQERQLPWRPVTIALELDGERLGRDFQNLYAGYTYNPDIVRVGFAMPATRTVDSARILFLSESEEEVVASWRVPESVVAQLNAPPEFALEALQIPDEASENVPVTVTVENTGDHQGIFYATLNASSLSHGKGINIEVPANDTVTWDGGIFVYQDSGPVDLTFGYGYDVITETVEITQ